ESKTIDDMFNIIKALKVRGAPLIGVAAALALAQLATQGATESDLKAAGEKLIQARPTAVNLKYCVDRVLAKITADLTFSITNEAQAIFEEDVALCSKMAEHGSKLIKPGSSVMTYCNTGGLATVGVGTALGVIKQAYKEGNINHVYVNETRPLLQGGRLTAWELEKAKIPYTLICDNMAATLMRDGKVSAVLVGADRIAANGDTANKIGTYNLACISQFHDVPFYVVAPYTTLDPACKTGEQIPIEERSPHEVKGAMGKIEWAPKDAQVFNPAFDVTPAKMIKLYIMDKGNLSKEALASAIPKPSQSVQKPYHPAFDGAKVKETEERKKEEIAPTKPQDQLTDSKRSSYTGI
ncbi:MAG: S-methyl-5-thioribose-1-phosphate isomerase, partial [Candidatus Berkiella sp.]